MKRWKIAVRAVAFILCLCLMIGGLTTLLKDKRVTFPYDPTRKTDGFYAEEKDSLDFVFIGSSQLFTSVVPTVLWTEYGMTSYNFAANEQTLELSYAYIQEALKYQKPKAIVLEISYCMEPQYAREGVKRINLDGLRWGMPKIQAILDTVEPGERFSYFFELAKYHDTWTELDQTSLQYLTADKHNPYKGYTPSEESVPEGAAFNEEITAITEVRELPEKAMESLQKIIDYTKEQGVALAFLKTPNGNTENQPHYNRVAEIARQENIPFLNLNSEMGGEKHNHVCYADDITRRVGQWLSETYETEDKRGQEAYARWNEDAKYYEHYQQMYELEAAESFEGYIGGALNGELVVLMAVDGSASRVLTEKNQAVLRQYGLSAGVEEGESYLAMLDAGKIYAEERAREGRAYKNKLFGHVITLVSQGEDAGNYAEITLDGEFYTQEGKGLHVVLYDPLLDEVVGERTFWQEM